MKNKNKIIIYFIGLLSLLFFFFPMWLNLKFQGFTFEQVMFNVMMITGESNYDAAIDFFVDFSPYFLVYTLIMMGVFKVFEFEYLPTLKIKILQHEFNVDIISFKFIRNFSLVVLVLSISFMAHHTQLISYIKYQSDRSEIFEQHYVDPQEVKLRFPERKRNLIHIVLESMETDFAHYPIDGEVVNLIPHLTELAKTHTAIKDHEDGGLLVAPGTGYTSASLVGQTSGLPLKVALGNKYGIEGEFLPGATSLGDILKEAGYNNMFLLGSDAEFGGRKFYYQTHGDYEIRDLLYMREQGKIPKDYHEFWGYEDKKLFDFAQETLLELAQKDEPFNFELLTVDTHFTDGYVDDTCELKYDVAYANAIACSDVKVIQFIEWIQQQDFYENTTIVISGDHPTMNGEFMSAFEFQQRRLYNVILNPAKPMEIDEYRIATVLDLFPTMLSSLGVEIEGNQLAMGTDLFSDTETLPERLGFEYFEGELQKVSSLYNHKILK